MIGSKIHIESSPGFVVTLAAFFFAALVFLGAGAASVAIRNGVRVCEVAEFQEQLEQSYASKVDGAAAELEVLKAVNMQLLAELATVDTQIAEPVGRKKKPVVMGVGGDER